MENFALIALVRELQSASAGMTVRHISRQPGRSFFLETRSGKMPGLRFSYDSRNPLIWIPGRGAPLRAEADDFVLILRKYLVDATIVAIDKPLSERIVEIRFRTALPTPELRQVTLVSELFPNSPNLMLLDQSRRIVASALPLASRRGLREHDEYRYPETTRLPLEAILDEDVSWFDADAFETDPGGWLLRTLAGMGPILAAEIAFRTRGRRATGEVSPGEVPPKEVQGMIRTLIGHLQQPARTAWVYTTRPLSLMLDQGDTDLLRAAVVSPIELETLRPDRSCQTFPGMLAAVAKVADALESANQVASARSGEWRRIRRELERIGRRREKLLARERRFRKASALQATARSLVSSGAEMDRHHAAVEVTEYTDQGIRSRSVPLDPARTLRENIERMFRLQQKAGRGLGMVERQLERLAAEEAQLRARQQRLEGVTRWEDWLAAKKTTKGPTQKRASAPSKRYRSLTLSGHEVLVGRNGRENDELTFGVAKPDDFWLHVADYSGSHVIIRNPTGAPRPDEEVLIQAAELAAYHSQARNSNRVDVHYTQRKFVSKPRKARAGLVRLRQFQTVSVEPRDASRNAGSQKLAEDLAGTGS